MSMASTWFLVVLLSARSTLASSSSTSRIPDANDVNEGDLYPSLPLDEGSVCGHDGVTYKSVRAAHEANTEVMHCGDCGQCSNARDIDIYWSTKDTLTETVTKCSVLYLLFGHSVSEWCMERYVGFTPGCHDCWLNNIRNTIDKCFWVCIKHKLSRLSFKLSMGDSQELDTCLECDERKSGPEFMRCAGANRRRSGVATDINRPDAQVCHVAVNASDVAPGTRRLKALVGVESREVGGGGNEGSGTKEEL